MRKIQRGPTPATTRSAVRLDRRPQPRAAGVGFDRLLGTPPSEVVVESVAEYVTVGHRPRSNGAPLAAGRYRR